MTANRPQKIYLYFKVHSCGCWQVFGPHWLLAGDLGSLPHEPLCEILIVCQSAYSRARAEKGIGEGLWALLHMLYCEQILPFDCIQTFQISVFPYYKFLNRNHAFSFMTPVPCSSLQCQCFYSVKQIYSRVNILMLLMASVTAHWHVQICLNRTSKVNLKIVTSI